MIYSFTYKKMTPHKFYLHVIYQERPRYIPVNHHQYEYKKACKQPVGNYISPHCL